MMVDCSVCMHSFHSEVTSGYIHLHIDTYTEIVLADSIFLLNAGNQAVDKFLSHSTTARQSYFSTGNKTSRAVVLQYRQQN